MKSQPLIHTKKRESKLGSGTYDLHCLFGPAVTYSDGTELYYIDGVHLSKEDYYKHPLVVNFPEDKREEASRILEI